VQTGSHLSIFSPLQCLATVALIRYPSLKQNQNMAWQTHDLLYPRPHKLLRIVHFLEKKLYNIYNSCKLKKQGGANFRVE
jgi:hypothetical protein